jgi:hypothetical protein
LFVPRAILALALVALITATATAELQWRTGRSALTRAKPRALDKRVQLASGTEGRVQFRSVTDDHGKMDLGLRLAQLPSADTSVEPEEPNASLDLPMPDDLPPLDAPPPEGIDMPPQADDDTLQLEQDQLPEPTNRLPDEDTSAQPTQVDTTMPPGPLPDRIPTPSVDAMQAERQKADEACDQGLEDLQEKTISTLDISIAVTGAEGSDYPFECSLEDSGWHAGRCWEETTYLWKASALCHKPLFFEDEQLERYGHSFTPCCQPLVSACHFFTRLPVLPYCMGVEPPNECIYALGHYRPGSCAPYMCNPLPLSCRGALFQAGAVVGAAAVLP